MSDDEKQTRSTGLDTVAIELKKAREAKNLSHTDLYRLTGISRSVLSGYETGRTKPGTKELKLLCKALLVNPNQLLFGSEEPFKPLKGLRGLAKLRDSPAGISLVIIIMPIIMASLDDEQLEAVLTLLTSLVEARDKETANKIRAIAEVFLEQAGNGTIEEMSALGEKVKDQEFMKTINKLMDEKIKSM